MSDQQEASSLDQETEQEIATYLRTYPDFFSRHLELLEALRIPHPTRPALSLIERQLLQLREQNNDLRKKMRELVAVARDNDCLSKRMQSLTLGLIEARTLDDLLTNIPCVLRDEFSADFIALRLVAQPQELEMNSGQEFISAEELASFESVLNSGRPRCGRLTADQASNLFDEAAPLIASAALTPLKGVDWNGLLAIGSVDERRFHPTMGTLFLSRIGDLISHALQPYLQPLAVRGR